jgi:hypothetical protein
MVTGYAIGCLTVNYKAAVFHLLNKETAQVCMDSPHQRVFCVSLEQHKPRLEQQVIPQLLKQPRLLLGVTKTHCSWLYVALWLAVSCDLMEFLLA